MTIINDNMNEIIRKSAEVDPNISGGLRLRTNAAFEPVALSGPGLVTEVPIDNTSWTLVIASGSELANRRVLNIQNKSGQLVKLNYVVSPDPGFVGIELEDGEERNYDALASFFIYARSQTSATTLIIEEVAHT